MHSLEALAWSLFNLNEQISISIEGFKELTWFIITAYIA